MFNLPYQVLLPLPYTHVMSPESMGLTLGGTTLATAASAVYVAANRALYIPFHLTVPRLVTQLFSANGGTAGNNIDMGIYSSEGGVPVTRLVSIGSTAQSGTNVLQYFNITDTQLGAGDFYLAIAMDGVTGTLFRLQPNTDLLRRTPIYQQATAFPLPATATPVIPASAYLPMIGATFS